MTNACHSCASRRASGVTLTGNGPELQLLFCHGLRTSKPKSSNGSNRVVCRKATGSTPSSQFPEASPKGAGFSSTGCYGRQKRRVISVSVSPGDRCRSTQARRRSRRIACRIARIPKHRISSADVSFPAILGPRSVWAGPHAAVDAGLGRLSRGRRQTGTGAPPVTLRWTLEPCFNFPAYKRVNPRGRLVVRYTSRAITEQGYKSRMRVQPSPASGRGFVFPVFCLYGGVGPEVWDVSRRDI